MWDQKGGREAAAITPAVDGGGKRPRPHAGALQPALSVSHTVRSQAPFASCPGGTTAPRRMQVHCATLAAGWALQVP